MNPDAIESPSHPVLSVADAIGPAMDVLAGLQKRMEAFYAEMRPKIAAVPQSQPCEFHQEHQRPIDFDLTCSASRERGQFTPTYQPCAVCVAAERASKARRQWTRAGVPQRVLEATFANFETETDEQQAALTKVKAWVRRRGLFLLLCGTPGTGKGHLASACLKSQGSGLWIEQVNMLGDLRSSYNTHTTESVVAKWQDCEMLVLDEFGLSPGGRDEEPMLYQVLAERYDKRRPTIITSNLDRAGMREAVGFRLLDRIREDCVDVMLNWKSHRTPQ